jgi:hypothetical protein
MGNTFNTEHAIISFVHEITTQGTITSDDAKELQHHLTDTIEQLSEAGLSPQEAFAVARIRFGYTNELAAEYSKVNGVNLLNREWVFLFLGAGISVLGAAFIKAIQFFIASKTAEGVLSISQSAWLLSAFYILLAIGVFWILKNGEKVSLFFKIKIFTSNQFILFLFAMIVSLLSLMPVQVLVQQEKIKNSFDALYDIVYYNSITELIIRGAVPLLLFLSIILSGVSVNKRMNLNSILQTNNYGHILLLSFVLEFLAAAIGRMVFTGSILSYFTFGFIIFCGLVLFSNENKTEAGLLKKQLLLLTVPFCIELWGTIMRSEGNITSSPILSFFISLVIAGITGIVMSQWFRKQKGMN